MATFTSIYHRKPYPAIDPAAPQNSMADRSVLIAGATSGLGLATAHAFVKASPEHVVILGRREEMLFSAVTELESARSAGSLTKIIGKQCDIGNQAQVDALWTDLKDSAIRISILILDAAATSLHPGNRLQDMVPSFDMNVFAGLRMADAFLAQGSPNGKVLINVSSMAAHCSMGPTLNAGAYSASKAAGAAAFQAAAEWKLVEEVQIINVHPGATLSESARRNGYDENTIPWDDCEWKLFCLDRDR